MDARGATTHLISCNSNTVYLLRYFVVTKTEDIIYFKIDIYLYNGIANVESCIPVALSLAEAKQATELFKLTYMLSCTLFLDFNRHDGLKYNG